MFYICYNIINPAMPVYSCDFLMEGVHFFSKLFLKIWQGLVSLFSPFQLVFHQKCHLGYGNFALFFESLILYNLFTTDFVLIGIQFLASICSVLTLKIFQLQQYYFCFM